METHLDIAREFLDLGISVIPIKYRSKHPVFAWKKYQNELPTENNLKNWFQSRFCNIAAITSGKFVVLDFDEWGIWELWKNWVTIKCPNLLNNTYKVRTLRGVHVFLFIDNPPERTMKIDKIDIKAGNGYVLVPKSIHPSGHQYRAINDSLTIATIDHLSDVMPRMLLDQARQDVIIPEYKHETASNGEIDVWNIAPKSNNGDSIAYIKRHVSILEFFPNARQTGQNWYMAHCPLHTDKQESASINTATNRIKCFKGCFGNRGADVIDMYCLLKKCDRKQAIRELSNGA